MSSSKKESRDDGNAVEEVAGTEDANDDHTMEQDSEVDVKTGLYFDRITAPEKHVRAKGRTTHTSKLIRMASQTTAGSDYGNKYVNTYGESVSSHGDTNGPYVANVTLSIPSTYALTKTHCGSRCVDYGPKDCVENADKFMEQCLRAPRVRNDVDTKEVQIANGVTQSLDFVSYDPSIVR